MLHFGVSYLEVLILFEQWAGHRLLSEKVTRPHVRALRPISTSSVLVSEGIEIWQGCRFISSLVRPLVCSLVSLAGSCHVRLGVMCPGFGIWGESNVFLGTCWLKVAILAQVHFIQENVIWCPLLSTG